MKHRLLGSATPGRRARQVIEMIRNRVQVMYDGRELGEVEVDKEGANNTLRDVQAR
jgi:hypothetical protein